jgi:hypothetical protein
MKIVDDCPNCNQWFEADIKVRADGRVLACWDTIKCEYCGKTIEFVRDDDDNEFFPIISD